MMLDMRNKRRGFTLLEISIFIFIIGILFAMLIPTLMRARAEGRLSACKDNILAIVTAENVYYTAHHYYATMDQLVDGEYIKGNAPSCPTGGLYNIELYTVQGMDGPVKYTVSCGGTHHIGSLKIQSGYPKYCQILNKVIESEKQLPRS